MFPTDVALIFMNLDMEAELDKVPMIVLIPSLIFSVTGRSIRQSFLVDKTKWKPAKTSNWSKATLATSVHLDK